MTKDWVPKRKEIEEKFYLLSDKLQRLQKARAFSSSVIEQFELDYRIQETRTEIEEIDKRLEQIEEMDALSLVNEFKKILDENHQEERKILEYFSSSLGYIQEIKETQMGLSPIFGKPNKTLKQSWADLFIIMPFREDLKPVYTDHIVKVANGLGLSCERGDDFFSSHTIIDEVWAATYFSKLCIADCTGRNPNVFYELGIAHTIGRPVILLAQSIDDIPFDIRHRRSIIYAYTPRGMSNFEETLKKTLESELSL
ncbi:hypothetical protein [Stenomitos frigidus]|uniref:Nucleoside 2-deoxyribosyltransferase n=1 Tax=Stenomitos frigidus ULC18 TaxID=2107698 RepID=A0A2T1DTA7_9CYAN|nr:hypothetical protein [Stenomitos frigidus]PSB23641.1 hypothetical protein C7B82_30685 [Stenomitos frigidus ULC18]